MVVDAGSSIASMNAKLHASARLQTPTHSVSKVQIRNDVRCEYDKKREDESQTALHYSISPIQVA